MKLRGLDVVVKQVVGQRVVLANGCFDILHVGHIRYLEAARRLGEVLVVALNDDDSARQLKGPGRPILSLNERACLVSALECVDHVIAFNEPDVGHVIEALKPAVHAKGTDYTEKSVPEANQVYKYGGEVKITGDSKDHSTRDILSRILNQFG